jgi:O-antigen/teichoic acid export membrane protein
MTTVRKSLLFSIAGSYVATAVQVIGSLIMARVLTPEETGVFAVTAAAVSLAHMIRDMGVGEYIVQTRELTRDKLRAAFTVSLGLSWGMGLAIFLGSWGIARFYHHEGAGQIARVLSLNFVLIPFGAIGMACFSRQLNFFPSFLNNTVGAVAGVGVAVGLGLAGWGYMSLAWSSLAGVIVTVLISVAMSPRDLPRLPGIKGCGEVLHFGKHIFVISLASQAGRSAPDIIVGRMIGITPAGYFSRAGGVTEIVSRVVLRAVAPVCLPYFASHAHERSDMKAGYLKALELLTVIAWPFYGFLGIAAYAAIRLLYGDQWMAAVPIAQVLCVAAAIEVTFSFSNELLISTGHVARNSHLVMIVQLLRTGMVLAAAPLGLTAVAWAMVGASVAGGLLVQRVLRFTIGLAVGDLARALRRNAAITIATLLPAVVADVAVGATPGNYVAFFFATGGACALTWFVAISLSRHPLSAEIGHLWQTLRQRSRR